MLLLLVGYSRQDYGDYSAAAPGNGCYKCSARNRTLRCVQGAELEVVDVLEELNRTKEGGEYLCVCINYVVCVTVFNISCVLIKAETTKASVYCKRSNIVGCSHSDYC